MVRREEDQCGMSLDSGQGTTGPSEDRTETGSPDTSASGQAPKELDLHRLAQDWITLWESELSALAGDPELREAWQAMSALWAGAMTAMLRTMPRGSTPWSTPSEHERPRRGAGPAEASRTAPVAAAPDPRDAEIDRLARHIDALERRLAEVERDSGARRATPRVRTRKRRPAE